MTPAALNAHLSRLALFITANRDSTEPRVVEQMHAAYTLRHIVTDRIKSFPVHTTT